MAKDGPAQAVVLGDLELVHALGRAGIGCAVAAPPDAPVRRSRFARAAIDAPRIGDLAARDDELLTRLLAFAERCREPPTVCFDSDEALLFLRANREKLAHSVRMVLPSDDLTRDLTDKARFQAFAERLQLPIPAAHPLVPVSGPPPSGLPFPLILKPVPRRNAGWRTVAGAAKALPAPTPAALEELWPRLANARVSVLAQQEIPGPESEVVSYHVYVGEDDEVAGEFTGRKIRTLPLERGMSTALVTTLDAPLAELGREVVRRVGLHGPAKLDFKRSPSGELHLLEINPRFTLWVHAGAVAGVNLPALMHREMTGLPRLPQTRARPGVRWVSFRDDRKAARAARLHPARWLAWSLRCETNSWFAWTDLGPLVCRLPPHRHSRELHDAP